MQELLQTYHLTSVYLVIFVVPSVLCKFVCAKEGFFINFYHLTGESNKPKTAVSSVVKLFMDVASVFIEIIVFGFSGDDRFLMLSQN